VVVALVPLALETLAALLRGDVQSIPFFLIFLLLPANLGLVGAVLTVRRPENVIGWLLLVAGVLTGLTFAAGEYERSGSASLDMLTSCERFRLFVINSKRSSGLPFR
jgi:hypothetical protein